MAGCESDYGNDQSGMDCALSLVVRVPGSLNL